MAKQLTSSTCNAILYALNTLHADESNATRRSTEGHTRVKRFDSTHHHNTPGSLDKATQYAAFSEQCIFSQQSLLCGCDKCMLPAAVDGKNNARLLGGDTFEVEISGPGNSAPMAEVTDNNDG